MDTETLEFAFKNVCAQKLRSNLTILGVIIGIAAIVCLVALGQGLNATIYESFAAVGFDTITVEPGGENFATMMFARIPEDDIETIEGIKGVKEVNAFYETAATIIHGKDSAGAFTIGIDPNKIDYLVESGMINLEEGRLLSDSDKFGIMIDKTLVEEGFKGKIGVRSTVEMKGRNFKVAGILGESDMAAMSLGGINLVYAHKDAVKEVFGEKNPMELIVKVNEGEDPNEVAERIEKKLEDEHGEKNFTVYTLEGLIQSAGAIIGLVSVVLAAIAGIALMVGAIGITNTMVMSIIERTQEIGAMKAIGATEGIILKIFVLESSFIGLAGGAIGAVLGYLTAFGVGMVAETLGFGLSIPVDPVLVSGAIGFSTLLGAVAGFVPARSAAKLDPVEALRYE